MLSAPLAHIISRILSHGEFPDLWKMAENKVKLPKIFKDLRPISLLYHMGKIAERILSSQLKLEFPALHNQFAYTNSIGTTDALVKFSNNITQQLDTTDTLAIQTLLLDLSKALDRMKPDVVVKKLLNPNVPPQSSRILSTTFSYNVYNV